MHGRLFKLGLPLWLPAAVIIGALTIFRLWAMSLTDLIPDEAYYWLWSRVPSVGYYDHPPMIAWWIWLSTRVLGDTPFGVRVLPVLSIFVTSMAVYGTAIELYDDAALARRAAIWLNAMLLISIEALFATPDAPSILFWALTIWTLARLRRTEKPALWVLVGLLAGAGCVAKYTNFFIGPGILLWLVVDPKALRWRNSPWVLIGGVLAFAVFSPVLIWNAEHGWISFFKQFGRIDDQHFSLLSVVDFIGGQFGLTNPVIAIFAFIASAAFSRRTDRAPDPLVFLAAMTSPLLIYLTFHSLHDWVHPNWSAPAYPALAIAAAAAAARTSNSVHLNRLALWASPVGIGLSSVVLAYFATPFGSQISRPTPADTVIGWQDLTVELEDVQRQAGAGWIATTDYGLTGEIAFNSQDPAKVQDIVERQRYSFEKPDITLVNKPALLVVRVSEGRLDRYLKCFSSVGAVKTLTRNADDRVIETFYVVKVSGGSQQILTDGCKL